MAGEMKKVSQPTLLNCITEYRVLVRLLLWEITNTLLAYPANLEVPVARWNKSYERFA